MIFTKGYALPARCVVSMRSNKKKGMEMAFSTIIAAALAVLILVIVVILLGKKFDLFQHETDKCPGRCVPPNACDYFASSKIGCPEGQVCCSNYCEDKDGICRDKCPEDYVQNDFYRCENQGQVCCQKR